MSLFLGIDTSNYTTSAAWHDDESMRCTALGSLLPVEPGKLGLRQSDALFFHVRQLPSVFAELAESTDMKKISAIGYSSRPRDREDSYMPCFLAGEMLARCLSNALGIPAYAFSHQQGHIASAAWSAGKLSLLEEPHLAWHLSGGTTELLYVVPDKDRIIKAEQIGGTTDLTAGQLIDRTGVLLGMPFPAGKQLDRTSLDAAGRTGFHVRVEDCAFSFSGLQNKAEKMKAEGKGDADIAYFILSSVAGAVAEATGRALRKYGPLPILCSGGVMANTLIRKVMSEQYKAYFAEPKYSGDNAAGPAILAGRRFKEG